MLFYFRKLKLFTKEVEFKDLLEFLPDFEYDEEVYENEPTTIICDLLKQLEEKKNARVFDTEEDYDLYMYMKASKYVHDELKAPKNVAPYVDGTEILWDMVLAKKLHALHLLGTNYYIVMEVN